MEKIKEDCLLDISLKMEFYEEIDLEQIAEEGFNPILKERFPRISFKKGIWIYQNKNKEIRLDKSSLELAYNKFGYDYQELIEDVKLIAEALNESEIEDTNYLSLRFIYSLPKTERNEKLYASQEMFNLDSSEGEMLRWMSKFEYEIDEDLQLYFQFGLCNRSYEYPKLEDSFILDYEARIDYADTRYLKKYTVKMHEMINRFFQESICRN